MHVRINDVTVVPNRVDELGEVLSNKALPVVIKQAGCVGLLCVADRTTGNCSIVSLWDSRKSLDASEQTIASIRRDTVDAMDARLNQVTIAEVIREISARPSQIGTRSRMVRITAPGGNVERMLDFYNTEAVPSLESQPGFLNARLIRDLDTNGRFAAVSHWTDAATLKASDKTSASLRERVAQVIPRTEIESVSTAEVIFMHRNT